MIATTRRQRNGKRIGENKLMETKPKYVKFEQNAVIILDDIDSRSIPLKDLKICELCTLTWKRPVYHYSPSAPAKPESPSKPDTDITSVNAKTPLFEASQESASPDGKSSTESTQQTETGGGLGSEV